MMSLEEYRVKVLGPPQPYRFRISHDARHLFYCGMPHIIDFESPLLDIIEDDFRQFMKVARKDRALVLVEGGLRTLRLTRKDAILKSGGEGGFITFLAHHERIPVQSPEPDVSDLLREHLTQFSKEDVCYAFYARRVAFWHRLIEKPDLERYIADCHFLCKLMFDFSRKNIANIHQRLFGSHLDETDKSFFERITRIDITESLINKILCFDNLLRDRFIVDTINNFWKMGRDLFIVYGTAHAMMQELALRELITGSRQSPIETARIPPDMTTQIQRPDSGKTLMDINLERDMPKATNESERAVPTAETVERAREAICRLGIEVELDIWNCDEIFWTCSINMNLIRNHFPPRARSVRISGKGPTQSQCVASCLMELVERWTLYNLNPEKKEHDCLDLRENRFYKISTPQDIGDTKCVASGNTYEDAILHALHELIETRLFGRCLWKPFKVVDVLMLFPDLPDWVNNNFVILKTPSEIEQFHHFFAVRHPASQYFDEQETDKIIKVSDRIFFSPPSGRVEIRSRNSRSAAGLDPKMTAFRAMNEILQSEKGDIKVGRRCELPQHVTRAEEVDLVNYASTSITKDIKMILKFMGEDAFVGVIDITHPELGIPVVKLISDWAMNRSVTRKENLEKLFVF